jgi:hypothetical protein
VLNFATLLNNQALNSTPILRKQALISPAPQEVWVHVVPAVKTRYIPKIQNAYNALDKEFSQAISA